MKPLMNCAKSWRMQRLLHKTRRIKMIGKKMRRTKILSRRRVMERIEIRLLHNLKKEQMNLQIK